jgi:hypothetical protein
MDIKTIAELFKELGFLWSCFFILLSVLGGLISYLLMKFIDYKIVRRSRADEEIMEIKRKRYDEFIESIEAILAREDNKQAKEYLKALNLIYSKMAISVPDNIVKLMTKEFDGFFNSVNRNRIYIEIRKDLLGATSLTDKDLKYWS